MKQYQHLSSEERFYIHQAVREGKRKADIARALQRHPSTIGREMRRNMWPSAYLYTYEWAMYFLRQRKRFANRHKCRKLTDELKVTVVHLLKRCLSPEQISAYLRQHQRISLSHESIYRFIYTANSAQGVLRCYLRHGRKKRRRRYGSGARATRIPNRTPIEARPALVERKGRIGDWECDTLVGTDRKSALVTVVERKSLFTLCAPLAHKTAEGVAKAIIALLRPVSHKVKTLTFDNGSEFIEHEKIAAALNAKTYFANPYSSWERGINENTNGLLRQFFPKATNFNMVTGEQIDHALALLNNRPRKTRQYKTPNEIFANTFVPLI
ncbi:MAG: IS30 family transposase [Betaproteobacteria bacterium]|nr:MAG: IS30 family transposase [Betaproteobacteria bacterium]